ncbi:DUF945 family protein [Delftia lacustris]|uniref:DUF945 family protein n=1 Tax=Delftia lacustris TaxID=558537 RepID=UPI0023B2A39C|nr:DUF945 family protein [Delftia lacustris]
MSNKKTAVAAAVALAVVAYGGTTWYTGQRAESGYKDAVAELRKVLGEKAVVTDEYHKGFLSSQAKLVLQWPAAGEADAPAAADAGAEAAPSPCAWWWTPRCATARWPVAAWRQRCRRRALRSTAWTKRAARPWPRLSLPR